MKKVLITGACGFVGKYLIKEFLENGYEILACDIKNNGTLPENVKYAEMNILNKEQIDSVISEYKPDYLINLAAISSVGLSWNMPQKTVEVNVIGTLNILESVKQYASNCKVLLIGSSEEYAMKNEPINEESEINANNPYGISKIAQENFAKMYIEKYGMKIVCTRSFNHTGIGQLDNFVIPSFCKQVAEIDKTGKSGKIFVGNLSAYRDISDVEDVVTVYRTLLEKDNDLLVYNVGSGKAHKIEDLLKYIISLSSQNVEIVIDKDKFRSVDTPYICCDNTKVKEYFKDTDIKDTIKRMYEYYKNN